MQSIILNNNNDDDDDDKLSCKMEEIDAQEEANVQDDVTSER